MQKITTETPELISFVAALQLACDQNIERVMGDGRKASEWVCGPLGFEVQQAVKFMKIWHTENGVSRSIHCFINRETGDIFKPASTKAPAKGVRGSIYSEQNGAEALDNGGGVRYLR